MEELLYKVAEGEVRVRLLLALQMAVKSGNESVNLQSDFGRAGEQQQDADQSADDSGRGLQGTCLCHC